VFGATYTVVSHIVQKAKGKMKTDRDFLKNYALLNSQIKLWPQLFTIIMPSYLLIDGRPLSPQVLSGTSHAPPRCANRIGVGILKTASSGMLSYPL